MRLRNVVCVAMSTLAANALVAGTSCRDGVAAAVATEHAPVIDGDLSDWNLSAPVLVWNAEELAETENATIFFMHDTTNFYVGYEMTLSGGRMPKNENRPSDRFWMGDLVQIRLCSDPEIGWPLPNRKDARFAKNPRVTCINLWRDTKAGVDYCHVTPGAMFDCPAVTNPKGGAVKSRSTPGHLVFEARIPWSALGVADGRCPFSVGDKMTAVADIKWHPGSDGHQTAAIFCKDPGSFAFLNIQTWGRIEFRPALESRNKGSKRQKGEGKEKIKKAYAEIASKARNGAEQDMTGWSSVNFDLPKRAKVSVNIFDEKGGVVRELIGGEWRNAGRVEVRWDGRDALGFPCETGLDYRWGVYAHDGLDVVYAGTVGTSGEPPYETPDGTGGWGADHGPVVACAADDTGHYFVWHKSEQGRGIVKTDFGGKVIWRTTPFVRGGWNEYTAACAADGALWLIHQPSDGKTRPALVRIDAATGRNDLFPNGKAFAEIDAIGPERPKFDSCVAANEEYVFNCAGIAAAGDTLFVSDLNGNRILMINAKTGVYKSEIRCDAPRGLAVATDGSLCAVSGKNVVRFDIEHGLSDASRISCRTLVSALDAPYSIAFAPNGTLCVSDLGESQQIKVFSGDGKLLRRHGKRGGRGFLGKIDYGAFLFPFGLAVDKTGTMLVAEASAPKIVSVMDVVTGAVRRRYFGYTAYSPSNVPDCDDPKLQYYSLSGPKAFARGTVGARPEASWDFPGAGQGEFGSVFSTMNMAEVMRCENGLKYLVPDGTTMHRKTERPMTICIVGEDDAMVPVAGVFLDFPARKGAPPTSLRLWMDFNGDGRRQENEFAAVGKIAGRTYRWTWTNGAMRMEKNGDLFLNTHDNAVICIPCRGFAGTGAPRWDAAAAYVAIPEIVSGCGKLYHTWRSGLLGLRRDKSGNFYAAVDCNLDYASPKLTKAMKLGMGHSSEYNGVFICKYAPDGSILWRVGRKATGGLKPGEMLHHWVFAGMVGDDYAVAASEWGVFTVYTADGFFVDSLFDPPGVPGRGAPYSFGGEDFSGRIAAFPALGEVWAYNAGHAFKVKGFDGKCHVSGEWRTNGIVRLERVAPLHVPGVSPKPIKGAILRREGGKVIFSAHIVDDTPLVNTASGANSVFKGGDAVGFEIGPGRIGHKQHKEKDGCYTRILAARIGGENRVIAFQVGGMRLQSPQEYTTPAGGTTSFNFVGDVSGAVVSFTPNADGYDVCIEVPEFLFELDFSKSVFWDAEALFSGNGGRGVGTVRRVYLHNEEKSQTSMVDDTPTEARLHPEGYAEIRL